MSADLKPDLGPRKPPWWYPRTRAVVAVCTSLLVLAGTLYAWYSARERAKHCAPGVEHLGSQGECVGITDDGYAFWPGDPQLQTVMSLIAAENKAVDAAVAKNPSRISISLAYLIAVPTNEGSAGNRTSIRHELEGAHIAQLEHNHHGRADMQGDVPLIRLLVANNGHRSGQWEPVARQLIALPDAPAPLLAVVGLGNSLDTTQRGIAMLSDHQIPMVGTVITADSMALTSGPGKSGGVPGFVRVAPTNTDEAKAAANHVKSLVRRPLVVHDINKNDLFSTTLVEAFRAQLKDVHPQISAETYDTDRPDIPHAFRTMMVNICQHRPDYIFFAGRGTDLVDFVIALATRLCKDNVINIVTGDSAANVVNTLADSKPPLLAEALDSRITLRFTGLAHPAVWESEAVNALQADYLKPGNKCQHCFAKLFPTEGQDDGRAIMAHDAMLTAITAIRNISSQSEAPPEPPIWRGSIIQQWNQFHGLQAIQGASGWISLVDGNPQHKAIPIVEIRKDGAVFIAVSSSNPDGNPFTPPSKPQ